MRYIRTKDNIYEISMAKEYGIDDLALKTADTIEELCDEFVYKNYFSFQDKPMLYPDEWDYKELLKTEPNVIVYGAIWTDKGLIYVAKMNEKGELEIL